ncbi:Cilia- and flagella-associated protein 251 [Entophlyctis sp. JEL0112]|nr:Cilia- and flagella-associated protein 251 [Entophlyctis sp. JEL0112]
MHVLTPQQNLHWTFGLNRAAVGGVKSLADCGQRRVAFYASSHTGVLFDWVNRKQQLLQGHRNEISAIAATIDKRWVVTADKGLDPVLIVWDTMPHLIHKNQAPGSHLYALPIKTIFGIHSGNGVVACEFTNDAKYLVTLGNEDVQKLMVWDWTTESDTPLVEIDISGEPQQWLQINPADGFEIMTNGHSTVNFFVWDASDRTIKQNVPLLNSKDFLHTPATFTTSLFIPTKHEAITATVDGDVVVWARHSLNNLSVELNRGEYACIKFMKLHQSSIRCISAIGSSYIATGGDEGIIKIFDLQLRLLIWFDKLKAGPVTSISFCSTFAKPTDPSSSIVPDLNIPEIVVATECASVLLLGAPDPRTVKTPIPKSQARNGDGKGGEDEPDIQVILETQYVSVNALVAHPAKQIFAVGGYSGLLQLWDCSAKGVLISRQFHAASTEKETNIPPGKVTKIVGERLKIESLAYSHCGGLLVVGFANGTLRVLEAQTLQDADGQRSVEGDVMCPYFTVATAAAGTDARVTHVAFSRCGTFLAAADAQHAVTVFKKEMRSKPRRDVEGIGRAVEKLAGGDLYAVWVQVGKCRAHYKEIISLIFVPPTAIDPNKTRLLSISKDRHAAEYDLEASTVTGGIKLISLRRIEQTAQPMAATWHPYLQLSGAVPTSTQEKPLDTENDAEETPDPTPTNTFLLTSNSEYKIRLHNSDTQLCRKTALGPTFCGMLKSLVVVPDPTNEQSCSYVAYSSEEKVAGLAKLPFDGNPHRFTGLIAHPCSISKIAVTFDGAFLLTAGYQDATVHMWSINAAALDAQVAMGGKDLEPFLDMLEDGQDSGSGSFYKEMEDYFYYAQLRSQGEDAATARLIQDMVEITEIPSIMQAIGFYPSENEIQNMINEVKYSSLADAELVDSISFPELIKLYINHKPVFDYSERDLLQALEGAIKCQPGLSEEIKHSTLDTLGPDDVITKKGLYSLLQQYGESMTKDELEVSFKALLSGDTVRNGEAPEEFTGREFIEEVMGLQSTAVTVAAAAVEKH